MYRLFLSLRFLRHHWLMTLIGSFFVGASLVILVVVMSVMDGFQARLKETIAGSSADLTLTPAWPCDTVAFAKALEELVPEVEVAGPFDETITMTRRPGRVRATEQKMHYAAVYGVDPRREGRINRFREYLSLLDIKSGTRTPSVADPDDPFRVDDPLARASETIGVVCGKGLMEDLDVQRGEDIRIAIAAPKSGEDGQDADATNVELKYVLVRVVGVYQSGNSEIDHSCIFMDHKVFGTLFGDDVTRKSVRCRLRHGDAIDATRAQILAAMRELVRRSALPGARADSLVGRMQAESWKEKNHTIVQAIESEKSMILVIAFLIVVAGTGSIFAAQWLLVSDKVREIGILRALGAGVDGVVSIFMLNGFLMGVIGSVGGAAGGLLVVRYIDWVHALISWILGRPVFDKNVYLFDRIPTLVDYGEVTRYAVAALACTLVASAVPAIRAGLMRPAEALHRE